MSFDPLAPWYQTLERISFGGDLQRCRVACLGEIATPQRALVVGEGDGRFLCELMRLHPGIEVDCIDESRRMLRLAKKRIERELPERTGRVRFLHQDITSWAPPEHHYDLLVTHFVLDCFPEAALTGIIEKLARTATDEANWLLADFCLPARGMARLRARAWLATMYLFFRLTAGIGARQLIDPTPIMRAEGFALARQHLFRKGLLKSELWSRGCCEVRSGLIRGAQAASLHVSAACRDAFVVPVSVVPRCCRQAAGNCRLAACAPQETSARSAFFLGALPPRTPRA